MQSENDLTLETYEKEATLYERRNIADYSSARGRAETQKNQAFLADSLKEVAKDATLFEVGSGYGRDAHFIQSLGYNITVSDAAESFLARLREEGFEPVKFNIITDDFPTNLDYVLANAVLVHLTKAESHCVLQKVYDALSPGGVFAFSVKQRTGGGEEWKTNIEGSTAKRYFSYWDAGEIENVTESVGFEIASVTRVGGIRACWLKIVARKPNVDDVSETGRADVALRKDAIIRTT